MPRIISGTAKGLRIEAPKGDKTRPTTDRVKESMFNILMPYVLGANVLDLFSGSGSLGIEALSRGAKKCVFNDYDRKTFSLIKKNIEFCKLLELADINCLSYEKLLNKYSNGKFDLIFLDPPYATGMLQKSVDIIEKNNMLEKDGIIVAEHPIDEIATDNVNLEIVRIVKYGNINMSLIKYKE